MKELLKSLSIYEAIAFAILVVCYLISKYMFFAWGFQDLSVLGYRALVWFVGILLALAVIRIGRTQSSTKKIIVLLISAIGAIIIALHLLLSIVMAVWLEAAQYVTYDHAINLILGELAGIVVSLWIAYHLARHAYRIGRRNNANFTK